MGPVSSKNSIRKRVFLDGRNFAPGHFCPQSRHLVCLASKIGEVRFSTKIQTENVFYGIDYDGNQCGPSLKDPLQVPDRPITRSRAKKIKEVMQGLVQSTWDEASKSPTIKVGLKEGELILIHLIQELEDMT